MISNVSFNGRETMLTGPAKKAADHASDFVGIGKIFSKSEIQEAQTKMEIAKLADSQKRQNKNTYTSPFALIKDSDAANAHSDDIAKFDIII